MPLTGFEKFNPVFGNDASFRPLWWSHAEEYPFLPALPHLGCGPLIIMDSPVRKFCRTVPWKDHAAVPVSNSPTLKQFCITRSLCCVIVRKWCHALCSILPNLLISRINVSSVYRTRFQRALPVPSTVTRIMLYYRNGSSSDGFTFIDHLCSSFFPMLIRAFSMRSLEQLQGRTESGDLIKNFQTEITQECALRSSPSIARIQAGM